MRFSADAQAWFSEARVKGRNRKVLVLCFNNLMLLGWRMD